MKNIFKFFKLSSAFSVGGVVALLALGGCAHQIKISPDLNALQPVAADAKINKRIGLYIDAKDKDAAVITPAGGGDKVSYNLYRDLETGVFQVLTQSFSNVRVLTKPADSASIQADQLDFVLTPKLSSNSSSPSPFTWPPTKFEVSLDGVLVDKNGKPVQISKVTGNGAAEFEEFKSDFALSGKRAVIDFLNKLQKALIELKALKE
jgi:hypothetical protein